MIGVKDLIAKLNTQLENTSLSEREIVQLYSAINSLETKGVSVVKYFSDLPNPAANQGRFVFIDSENRYVFSDGSEWNINTILAPASVNLWGWGSSSYIGDNSVGFTRSSPVSVVGGFTDWVDVSAGYRHTVAMRANGTAWAWGSNGRGQLGNNENTVQRSSPVSVVGGYTDWVQISAGRYHTAAVRANGTAWCWGYNYRGRLGDNSTTSRSSPVLVVGGFTNWVQISAGRDHTAAVRANGTAWCWGWNAYGQLGDESTTSRLSPVSVVGGFTDWVQISAGAFHTAAVRANGTAWCWGWNNSGRLGDDSTTSKRSPVLVVGDYTDWVQIDASNHTAAVRANGTVWCWGANGAGQLGNNSTTNRSSPVSVVGDYTDWVQISAGGFHTAAVRANGTAWAWGDNTGSQNGVLGNGEASVGARSSPVSVVGSFTDWVMVSCDRFHTMGLRS